MIKVTLKGNVVKEFDENISLLDVAKNISEGFARNVLCASVNGEVVDLRTELATDCEVNFYTFDDLEGKKAFWHTSSHIMAQAVKRLFPQVKLAIGPATSEGFYYDFDKEESFNADDVKNIEAEMKKIVKEALPIESFSLSRSEALELVKDEPYKVELINELPEGETISFFKQGEFVDLCKGPHLFNTKYVKAIKITTENGSSGAYWKGSEKNKMLCRLYGISFQKASDLTEYLEQKEEAMKRDHNKLGRELKLFTTSDVIGQGLPLLMPKGARIVQILQRFVEDEEQRRGYLLTKTPFMAKNDLYKISGHWDHYKDGMFVLGDKDDDQADDVFALRPMTCPFQFTVYNAESHSYRDLPLRYNETSSLFRNESSGEMHGLIRVRQFTISEGHIACTKEQLTDEFKGCVALADFIMETLGIKEDVRYMFSKWDEDNKEKYIGDAAHWTEVQDTMRVILDDLGLDYEEVAGEAAFYGPKLDILCKNVHGKEDTIITIQIDFALAERFNMTYVDSNGEKVHPMVLHRTSIGCYERTLALLIEKYAGAFPTWLAPTQVKVLPISDKYADYAQEVVKALESASLRVECDNRVEKIGYKIREARNERVPYIVVVGEEEKANGQVSVRSREGDEGAVDLAEFVKRVSYENVTRFNNGGYAKA